MSLIKVSQFEATGYSDRINQSGHTTEPSRAIQIDIRAQLTPDESRELFEEIEQAIERAEKKSAKRLNERNSI